ncbi:hypothetical protein [Flaviaesturariibacter amylovorans]|uniref:Molybdate metabolism regulator n=1 Tax=Flaviaesturariibacter amylovorans TaxID=1084520 RepID=A0ABP8G870_9BACT
MFEDDDIDEIALANAHPTAQKLMKDEFFYSVVDDSAPFGNDDGWDVLYSLKEWLPDNEGTSKKEFIDSKLSEWDYPAFNYLTTDIEDAKAFVRSSEIGLRLLMGIDQAIIATAFGQLYLEGKIDEDLSAFAETVINRQSYKELIELWGEHGPNREMKLQKMLHVLHAAR